MKPKIRRIVTILACALAVVLLLGALLVGFAAKSADSLVAPGDSSFLSYNGDYLREATTEAQTMPAAWRLDGDYGNIAYSNAAKQVTGVTTAGSGGNPEDGRFVIVRADITLQTKTYDAFIAALKADLKTMGGYTNSFDEWNYDSGRHASLIARVPSQQHDIFMENLAKNGTVVNVSSARPDVTDEMIETGSRKEAYKAEESALLAILEKAQSVEDIIRVQDRLSVVRAELESYSRKLQSLQNQVEYSTVNIDVQEVNRITTPTQKFGALASSGFLGSLRDIGSGLRNFALWFIGAIPYLVMLAVPVTVFALLFRRWRRNKRAKKAAGDA